MKRFFSLLYLGICFTLICGLILCDLAFTLYLFILAATAVGYKAVLVFFCGLVMTAIDIWLCYFVGVVADKYFYRSRR